MWYAHNMVWKWGMGNSGFVGNYSLLENMRDDYGAFRGEKSSFISENLKEKLNLDVQDILSQCLKEVEDLLIRENALLDRFAQELLNKDELNYDEIEAIFKEFGKARPPIS
jgi:ATP-dependent Zn protease